MNAFKRTATPSEALRRDYLKSLSEPQEWFLEELVQSGEVWEMPGTGYGVFHEGTLVEFFMANARDAVSGLTELRDVRPFEVALCKSFDQALLEAATALGGAVSEVGFLFRKRNRVNLTKPEGFRIVSANPRDLEEACKVGGDFFSSREEVVELLNSGCLWIAWCQSEIVGCGVTSELGKPFNAVDVGMVVSKLRRNQGFGTAIVMALSNALEGEGKMPICGCAKRNVASKNTLERAGFVSEHRLLRIQFPA